MTFTRAWMYLAAGRRTSSSDAEWKVHTERRNLCFSTRAFSLLVVILAPPCMLWASTAKLSRAERIAAWMYVISCKGGRPPEPVAGCCLLLVCICCCAQSSAQRTVTPSWALQHLLGLNGGVVSAAEGQRGLVRWGCDAGDSHVESSCTRRRSETTSFTCTQESRRLSQAQMMHARGTTL